MVVAAGWVCVIIERGRLIGKPPLFVYLGVDSYSSWAMSLEGSTKPPSCAALRVALMAVRWVVVSLEVGLRPR